MSLTTPSKLRELQIKLYRKAKNEASTGAIARHQPLQSKWYSANWGKCSSAESGSNLVRESAVKPVGKPDALIGHVRFDERGWETGRRSGVSTRAHPRLYKCAGLNRHVVRNERVLQERRERIHLGPESCGGRREAPVEA
jgi:hypothetical protein